MRRFSSSSRKTGFTLIELLVVVSIIALLISILLPSLRSARNQAKKVKCMANLHAIGLSLFSYADDNRQDLPSYQTMGQWGYRVAPGKKTDPDGPPEAWGLQSVLETGTAPEILPSGIARPVKFEEPAYLPSDSPVWICPANPGLHDREEEWKDWANGYMYRQNSSGVKTEENPTPNRLVYNVDWLNRKGGAKNPIVWDNYYKYPGDSGFIGPFGDGYSVDLEYRVPPHRVIGGKKRGSARYWIAFYARGHCEINAKNLDN
jgi:prepilin-type N-terminal cleavage/methylation domain-containing protein